MTFSGVTIYGRVWRKGAGKQGLDCDRHCPFDSVTIYSITVTRHHEMSRKSPTYISFNIVSGEGEAGGGGGDSEISMDLQI